jgi:uncharacterized protein
MRFILQDVYFLMYLSVIYRLDIQPTVDLQQFSILSKKKSVDNKKFLLALKKKDARRVDDAFHEAHAEVFETTDCLECANCCKTTSPIFYQNDIERLSRALRMRPGDFIDKYLRVDEDKDYVLRSAPCPFLDSANRCTVYDDRPKACREYPHTNRKKMVQIMELTHRNTLVCPAVFLIVERLKTKM